MYACVEFLTNNKTITGLPFHLFISECDFKKTKGGGEFDFEKGWREGKYHQKSMFCVKCNAGAFALIFIFFNMKNAFFLEAIYRTLLAKASTLT